MGGAVPPWAHEKAEVCAYDPQWAGRATTDCARLTDLLAPWLVDGVEHVGSTAVPGLAAKPIVDLMVSVRYETVKRRLAEMHGHDREAYTDTKAEFVVQALRH
jgi:GrpB-like predicted nucleotidyltransferase (UPF0157 family)